MCRRVIGCDLRILIYGVEGNTQAKTKLLARSRAGSGVALYERFRYLLAEGCILV